MADIEKERMVYKQMRALANEYKDELIGKVFGEIIDNTKDFDSVIDSYDDHKEEFLNKKK